MLSKLVLLAGAVSAADVPCVMSNNGSECPAGETCAKLSGGMLDLGASMGMPD